MIVGLTNFLTKEIIPPLLVCFSGIIGYLIRVANKEEIPKYERWIQIWEQITAITFGVLFPIFLPFAVIMALKKRNKIIESIAFGVNLIVNSWVGLSLLAMYQMIEYRKYNLKETIKYNLISFSVFIGIFLFKSFIEFLHLASI